MLRITKSPKNLSLSMAEDAKVGSIGGGSDCKDKTVERSPLIFENLNRAKGYPIPGVKQGFI